MIRSSGSCFCLSHPTGAETSVPRTRAGHVGYPLAFLLSASLRSSLACSRYRAAVSVSSLVLARQPPMLQRGIANFV